MSPVARLLVLSCCFRTAPLFPSYLDDKDGGVIIMDVSHWQLVTILYTYTGPLASKLRRGSCCTYSATTALSLLGTLVSC